jgi:hypothetical protein
MEIPYMILDEVKRLERKDIERSEALICLVLNNINYEIKVSPSFLEYRGFYFRTDTLKTFETVIQNLLQNILEENSKSLNFEIEYNNYNPTQDPLFEKLQIVLMSNNASSMSWEFTTDDDNILYNFTKSISFFVFFNTLIYCSKNNCQHNCQHKLSKQIVFLILFLHV